MASLCSSSSWASRERVPELVDQRLAVAPLGPGTEPVEQGRVADQELAEVLARAEELDEDLRRPHALGQHGEGLVGPRAGGDEPLQVRQRHAGSGHRGSSV